MSKPETITIDEVKYVRADSVQTVKPVYEGEFQPFELGAIYAVRTVTMIDVGRVVAASKQWIVLADAAWVADTGRWADFMLGKVVNEVEPFPEGLTIVACGAVIDAAKYPVLLRKQK